MAKVTGFTAERMLEIERSTVVHGAIEDADELVLYTRGGDRIRAGSIKGGTAEWIRDTQPVIEEHNKIIADNRESIQQMHDDIREATGVIEDLDGRINTDLPIAMDKAQSAMDDAVAALKKASNTVKDTIFEYAVSNSDTVAPTSGWSTERPARNPGQTIWMRTLLTKNNDSPGVYTFPIPLTGDEGDKGDKGVKGDAGADGNPGVSVVSITPLYRRVCIDDPESGSASPEVGSPRQVFLVDGQLEYEK